MVDASDALLDHHAVSALIGGSEAARQRSWAGSMQKAAADIGDFLAKMGFSATAANPAPSDANSTLALAVLKLHRRDPEAGELFASVVHDHDVREAWLGLAIAHHFEGETTSAGIALAHALSRHVVSTVPPIATSITQSMGAPGWCALDCTGKLTVRLVRALRARSRLVANLDGEPVRLSGKPGGREFFGKLANGWRSAGELRVHVNDLALLGSPITLKRIARVEGFVDSSDGDLHGWAWCPNDPDYDPVLSIVPCAGGRGITAVASNLVTIATKSALARPRAFRVPVDKLSHFDGPVRLYGPDGRDLTGSPLDPSAERRSGEAAAKLVADLFAAPGTAPRIAARELTLLSVPAHVTGGPVVGGNSKRPVEIVVPVYGELELTLACLDSVLSDLPPWARVLVIDDASPDPRVGRELQKLAAAGRITLLTMAANQGFPGAANEGMRKDPTRDVVLLNSDTLVPPGWLAALRKAAYSAADIGSATPFSNNATILSYPSAEHPNAIPDLSETIRLNELAQDANAGRVVDIPTAVGFCVYIKRDCLKTTGLLREDLFAQGYGEENDFCIRARHLGWRHVAVPAVFVAHVGGQSFGSTKQYLIERNIRKLNRLHPGYDALIREFKDADPMAEPRRRLDLTRWATFRTGAQSVLLITHGRDGGVQRHVADRAAALRAEGFRPIVLWPVASRGTEGRDCVLGNGIEGGTPNMRFSIPGELDLLTDILEADNPAWAEVHHMIGHDHRLLDLFARLGIPYEITVHDYSWFCPRINLIGADRRYCGEPEIAACEACIADAGPKNDETTPPRVLRQRSHAEMAEASAVIVASTDVAVRLKRHFPSVQPRVVGWEDDSALPAADPAPMRPDGIRRVCVVGAIGIEKGYEVLLGCARDAANRRLKLRFILVGHSCDDERLMAVGNVEITGRYAEHDAVGLIRRQGAQSAWLPALWPETWSYTLTQAWQAGLNVLAFDIGTPAERIRRTQRGWLCPLGMSPRALNELMITLRPTETEQEPPLWLGKRNLQTSVIDAG